MNTERAKAGSMACYSEALGIDSTTAVAFVSASQPGYLAFEAWVKENAKPESLTPEAIDQFNKRILSFPKPRAWPKRNA